MTSLYFEELAVTQHNIPWFGHSSRNEGFALKLLFLMERFQLSIDGLARRFDSLEAPFVYLLLRRLPIVSNLQHTGVNVFTLKQIIRVTARFGRSLNTRTTWGRERQDRNLIKGGKGGDFGF